MVAERKHPLDGCVGFDWDEANVHKNWERHQVTPEEAEAVFFNEPLVIRGDTRHSQRENRYYALGRTGRGRRWRTPIRSTSGYLMARRPGRSRFN